MSWDNSQIKSSELNRTQMSFHDSGSAVLDVNKILLNFIKDHLVDITYNKKLIVLEFDTNVIPIEFKDFVDHIETQGKFVIFNYTRNYMQNKDPVEGLKRLRDIIKVAKIITKSPSDYYQELMTIILDVGSPYSSFVECLFTNMFLSSEDGDLWRYNQSEKIVKKLGDKTLASRISPLLNLLYQQNQRTIENIDFLDDYINNTNQLTVYEKLFLEKF